jgi:DNA-binding transcriptional MocR family regulator
LKPSAIRALFAVAARPEVVSLAGGMPYVTALNMDDFANTIADMIRKDGDVALQYGSGQGHPVLREYIREVMAPVGVACEIDDILVTAGSQMALDLIVRLLVDPDDVVLVESPSYVGALGVFTSYQADVRHVEMSEGALDPDSLISAIESAIAAGKRPKFIYTVASFQNPGGTTATQSRREQILEIAQRYGVLILEDDPYGLLGFGDYGTTKIPQAIRAMSQDVIYLGSFSKTIASGVRIGWAVVPAFLREKLVLAAESATLCPSHFTQFAVMAYLENHDWRAQINTYRALYQERRDAMISAMQTHMPNGISWTVPAGGFYSWLTLPEGLDSQDLLPKAVDNLVAFVPGSGFFVDGQGASNLRLSYCYPTAERITEGIVRLAEVIRAEI